MFDQDQAKILPSEIISCGDCKLCKPSKKGAGVCMPLEALQAGKDKGPNGELEARLKAKSMLLDVVSAGLPNSCPKLLELERQELPIPYRWKTNLHLSLGKEDTACMECFHLPDEAKKLPKVCPVAHSIMWSHKNEAIAKAFAVRPNLPAGCPNARKFEEIRNLDP